MKDTIPLPEGSVTLCPPLTMKLRDLRELAEGVHRAEQALSVGGMPHEMAEMQASYDRVLAAHDAAYEALIGCPPPR